MTAPEDDGSFNVDFLPPAEVIKPMLQAAPAAVPPDTNWILDRQAISHHHLHPGHRTADLNSAGGNIISDDEDDRVLPCENSLPEDFWTIAKRPEQVSHMLAGWKNILWDRLVIKGHWMGKRLKPNEIKKLCKAAGRATGASHHSSMTEAEQDKFAEIIEFACSQGVRKKSSVSSSTSGPLIGTPAQAGRVKNEAFEVRTWSITRLAGTGFDRLK
ncbi:hypothetical protein DFS34DRAFT_592377 [Phlyctochytrium arcticum]|nr:hypothetical protein DFS34DRAFT_592377 [Phlyctochytrium arcticum]